MASLWCLYSQLWTYFTPCSSVSIVNFEQVNAGWVASSNEIKTHIVLKIVGVNLTGTRPTKLQCISLDLGKLPIVMKLKSIYAEPSSETLLKYCLYGVIQSQNESFIVRNCDRILETHFVSCAQLEFGVYDAVPNFNIDRTASLLFEKLRKLAGKYTLKRFHLINKKRLLSTCKIMEYFKKYSKVIKGKLKQKENEMTKRMSIYMPWNVLSLFSHKIYMLLRSLFSENSFIRKIFCSSFSQNHVS